MKLNKIILLSALGCFALPIMAAEAPKAEEHKADAPKAEATEAKKPASKKKHAKKAHKKAAHKDAHAAPALPTTPTVMAAAPAAAENVSLKISGFVNAVANYDLNGFGGDFLNVGAIPTDSNDITDKQKQVLTANVKATRLAFDASKGIGKAHISADFYGTANLATYKDNNNVTQKRYDADELSSATTLRLRKAYIQYGGFMIGQDDSLFVTYPQVDRVDFAGHFGGGQRQFQARYTYNFSDMWNLAVGLEKAPADIYQFDSNTETRKQNIPDFTAKLGVNVQDHTFGLRTVLRNASATATDLLGTAYTQSTMGWGVGVDAKIATMKDSAFVAVVNYGKGIGRYISEHEGQSYLWTGQGTANGKLSANKMFEWGVGYGHAINEQWKVNAGYSTSKMTVDNSDTSVKLERYFGNVAFSPVKELTFALEYSAGKIKTNDFGVQPNGKAEGKRNRITLAATYRF